MVTPCQNPLGPHTRVILVTLGGSAATARTDRIMTLAKRFANPGGRHHDERVYGLWGKALPTTASHDLAGRIRTLRRRAQTASGHAPRIVLVGKSMGGCKLHKVVEHLERKRNQRRRVTIDLFVGVDMSCYVDRHWEAYIHACEQHLPVRRILKVFPPSVTHLVNFVQTRGDTMTGHPAYWESYDDCKSFNGVICRDYNIDVNSDAFEIDPDGEIVPGRGAPVCTRADHWSIDECKGLVDAICTIIERRILATL